MTTSLDDMPAEGGKAFPLPLILNVVMEPGDDTAPLRVLSLLARRRCRVQRAAFALADAPGRPELRLEIIAPPGREATVQRWVAALVSVRDVTREPA